MSTMKTRELKIYAETDSIKQILLVANGCAWMVKIQIGSKEGRWLTTDKSKEPRIFTQFPTMLNTLLNIGCDLGKLDIDANDYDPDAPKKNSRPDVSKNLKDTHEKAKQAKLLCPRCGESFNEETNEQEHDCEETSGLNTPPLLIHDRAPDPG